LGLKNLKLSFKDAELIGCEIIIDGTKSRATVRKRTSIKRK
jgi:hypothetical protein